MSDTPISAAAPRRRRRSAVPALLLILCGLCGSGAAETPSAPIATLLVAGDIADCRSPGAAQTAELVDRLDGIVLAAGDLAYPNGSLLDFKKCYEPSWGRFKARTLPTPGNHEYQTPTGAGYFAYFGGQAGENGKGYYSTELQGWHIIALNSNIDVGADSEQLQWLRKDLANTHAPCILAFWHHPRYTSGAHGNNKFMTPIWEALAERKASIVVAGHDHNYERIAPLDGKGFQRPDGIRSFVVGTGGARLFDFGMRSNYSEAWNGTTWGVLKLELFPGHYTWNFLPVAGGKFQDSGASRCAAG